MKLQFNLKDDIMICFFTPTNYKENSAPDDLLISVMFDTPTNIFPATKSLRTTGSRCTLVILTDNFTLSKIPPKELSLLEDHIFFQVICDKKPDITLTEFFTWRQMIVYKFITENKTQYKRVIVFDLFDTLFQGDPFSKDFLPDKIYFSEENIQIHNSQHNQYLLKPILPDLKAIEFNNIINGGLFGGGINPTLDFLKLYLSKFDENLSLVKADDQAYFNVMIHTGELEKAGIPYEIDKKKEHLLSISGSLKILSNYSLGQIWHPGADHPGLVIHQYKQSKQFLTAAFAVCPRGGLNVTHYMPVKKARYIDQMQRCVDEGIPVWYSN